MEKARIIIVDENDNIIGYKKRGTLEQSDIYRVSALWITNDKGEFLLARRAYTKKNNPGEWGPAVAGTVDEGEDYLINIIKETEEELGLTISGSDLKVGPKKRTSGKHNYFGQWYFFETNKQINDFKIQEEEVAEIKWFSKEELLRKLETNKDEFLSSLPRRLKSLGIL